MLIGEQEQKLEELVKQYVAFSEMIESYEKEIKAIPADPSPAKVTSLTEALQYAGTIRVNKERRANLIALGNKASGMKHKIGEEIIALIPMPLVWIKVGKWAVGTYTMSGGRTIPKTELSVEPWEDKLPPLYNRTY